MLFQKDSSCNIAMVLAAEQLSAHLLDRVRLQYLLWVAANFLHLSHTVGFTWPCIK